MMIFLKNIICPEKKCRAVVELVAAEGKFPPYSEVRTCSLQKAEKGILCLQACLTSPSVIQAPFTVMRSDSLRVCLTGFEKPAGEKRGRATTMSLLAETIRLMQEELGDDLGKMRLEGLVVGVFFTGVKLTGKFAGMARTPIEELSEAVCCPGSAARMPDAGRLKQQKVSDLMQWALDANVLKAAVGVATLNALSHCLWEKKGFSGCKVIEAKDAFDLLDFTRARRVALVGAFSPYIRQIERMGLDLAVVEKNPQVLRGEAAKYFHPAEDASKILSHADVVILTGSTIVNHTIDDLLSLVRRNCQVAIVGPTASLAPQSFFNRGVSLMGGMRITDPDNTLRVLAEGGSGHHIDGKYGKKVVFVPLG